MKITFWFCIQISVSNLSHHFILAFSLETPQGQVVIFRKSIFKVPMSFYFITSSEVLYSESSCISPILSNFCNPPRPAITQHQVWMLSDCAFHTWNPKTLIHRLYSIASAYSLKHTIFSRVLYCLKILSLNWGFQCSPILISLTSIHI